MVISQYQVIHLTRKEIANPDLIGLPFPSRITVIIEIFDAPGLSTVEFEELV
ncbi:hypothetical protein [Coleofasciculus sp. E1-EBD-02]|uniref:hypothetical protein n=1 Tax=Coleofasciculus sp. E1-EBD-02 TaxID=3068481 RepID=UPI0033008FD2